MAKRLAWYFTTVDNVLYISRFGGVGLKSNIDKLVHMSNFVGKQIAYIQGGGGNTSLKISDSHMLIKKSGMFLADISDEKGFLTVDWRYIRDQIRRCRTEADYNNLLIKSKLLHQDVSRPSIETGFHALLDCCTLHTHSVWANLLTCAREGQSLVACLFPTAIWMPYATPGLELTRIVSEYLNGGKTNIIFLQNHGLIVSGPDTKTCLDMHENVTETIRMAYPDIQDFNENSDELIDIQIDGLLFPDQAIYHSDPILSASRAGRETMQAVRFLIDRMKQQNIEIKYIGKEERSILLNMESEKFRQDLLFK
jgi:rhamnose utilization protein RhaD (predicted bifunctional aldolase and dehydrogenase)